MKRVLFLTVILAGLGFSFGSVQAQGWLSGWDYRKAVTIDFTKIDSNLTDFPTLVKLNSANFDFAKARSDGFDIRFTSSDGQTLLKYERERHDAAGQLAEYWIKIPSVSNTANTVFYIYYGNSTAPDGADPTNVWDTDAKLRYSMKDLTNSSVEDSTLNNRDGTKASANNPPEADGKIARAQSFDGVNDLVNAGNMGGRPTVGTISFWMKADIVENHRNAFTTGPIEDLNGWGNRAIRFEEDSAGSFRAYIGNDSADWGSGYTAHAYLSSGLTANTWYFIALVWDAASNNVKGYLDGVQKFNNTNTTWPSNLNNVTIGMGLGLGRYWKGLIDEVQIYYRALSPAWIKASYNSGNNSLVGYGSEEIQALGWLSGYGYRKQMNISSPSGAQTDYQIKLIVNRGAGADSGNTVYLNSRSSAWPNDIRFTKSNGTTLLNFWAESSDADRAVIWVKFDSISISPGNDFYIYYGNPTAPPDSNLAGTFIREIDGAQPLKGSWHFDDNALDTSGNAINGTLINGASASALGKFGQAVSLDGLNDYVSMPHNAVFDVTDFTVELWVKVVGAGTGGKAYWTLINKNDLGSGFNDPFHIWVSNAYIISARVGNGSAEVQLNDNTAINDGLWHQVVLTRSGNVLSLYRDNTLKTTANLTGSAINVDSLMLGFWMAYNNYFNGLIDEVRIYNRALTVAEISDLYNNYGYTTVNYAGRVLVRKYASPEPVFGAWGPEEQQVGIVSLDVSKVGTGAGTVTGTPTGINCGGVCSWSYSNGTIVTLTASVEPGSTFAGWSGAGCSGNGNCIVTMDSAKSVTATFASLSSTWLLGYDYRKKIAINGTSAGTQTDYQMKLIVNKGIGSDSGNIVYFNNHSLNWPNDIRFTGSNGVTLLDYWVESSNVNTATVWVKFNSIVYPGTSNFYIYYGNSSATSNSNANAAFLFFENFETYPLGDLGSQGGWTRRDPLDVNAFVKIISGSQVLDIGMANGLGINTPWAYHNLPLNVSGGEVTFRVKRNYINSRHYAYINLEEAGGSGSFALIFTPMHLNKTIRYSGGPYDWTQFSPTITWVENQWYTVRLVWYGNSKVDIYIDGVLRKVGANFASAMTSGINRITFSVGSSGDPENINFNIDDIIARKYVFPEPTFGTWGSERSQFVSVFVSREGTGSGKVISLPAGVDCGNDCNESFLNGTVVTLTALADPGSTFVNWAGPSECVGGVGDCILTLEETKNVKAVFMVKGCQMHNTWKWAWSNMSPPADPAGVGAGWISFGCDNTIPVGGDYDYGVDVDLSSGNFSGYAWSENIGWIKFAPAGPYPSTPNYFACMDFQGPGQICDGVGNYMVSGWARALTYDGVSWDGWIKLRKGPSDGGPSYGVYIDTGTSPREFGGWAWGDSMIGWISFNDKDFDGLPGPFNYQVFLNFPPNKPVAQEVIVDPCAIKGGLALTLNWTYSDPDGDLQTAYEIELDENPSLDENSSFNAPKFNHLVAGPTGGSTGYVVNLADDDDNDWPTSFDWNATYWWHVRTKDQRNNWSVWSSPSKFKTQKNASPFVKFSWDPPDPTQKETVEFRDTTETFGSPITSWLWSIITGTGVFVDSTGPTSQNPNIQFDTKGENTVRLEATDGDGLSCFIDKSIDILLPLPDYKEISPVGWFQEIFTGLLAFLTNF